MKKLKQKGMNPDPSNDPRYLKITSQFDHKCKMETLARAMRISERALQRSRCKSKPRGNTL